MIHGVIPLFYCSGMSVRLAVVDIDALNLKVIRLEQEATAMKEDLAETQRKVAVFERQLADLAKRVGTSAVQYG
jgi:hypothetical protein